jgi:hypothetical protein
MDNQIASCEKDDEGTPDDDSLQWRRWVVEHLVKEMERWDQRGSSVMTTGGVVMGLFGVAVAGFDVDVQKPLMTCGIVVFAGVLLAFIGVLTGRFFLKIEDPLWARDEWDRIGRGDQRKRWWEHLGHAYDDLIRLVTFKKRCVIIGASFLLAEVIVLVLALTLAQGNSPGGNATVPTGGG